MQSRPLGRRRKKADGGRCGLEIEAAISPPVFGQTRSIEFALGVIFFSGKRATASWLRSAPILPRIQRLLGLAAQQGLGLIAGLGTFSADQRRASDGPDLCCSGVSSRSGRAGRAHRHDHCSPFHQPDDSRSPLNLHGWLVQKDRTSCSGRCGAALLRLTSPPALHRRGRPARQARRR